MSLTESPNNNSEAEHCEENIKNYTAFQFALKTSDCKNNIINVNLYKHIRISKYIPYPISSFMKVKVGQCWHMHKSLLPQSTVAICDQELRST